MPNQPSREEELYKTALKLATPEERLAYLKLVSAGDAALMQSVMARLQAHDRTGNSPDPDVSTEVPPVSDLPAAEPITERPGQRIGRYKLLQQINEGGMGVVYMAEQDEPVRRRVALKVIKLGMDVLIVLNRSDVFLPGFGMEAEVHLPRRSRACLRTTSPSTSCTFPSATS